MHSGTACALRVCRSCRLSIQQPSTPFACVPRLVRGYARGRDSGIAQKDQVEALIRGEDPPVDPTTRSVPNSGSRSRWSSRRRHGSRHVDGRRASDPSASQDVLVAMIRGGNSSSRDPIWRRGRSRPLNSSDRQRNTWGLNRGKLPSQPDPWAPTSVAKVTRIREEQVSNTEDLMNLLDSLHNPRSNTIEPSSVKDTMPSEASSYPTQELPKDQHDAENDAAQHGHVHTQFGQPEMRLEPDRATKMEVQTQDKNIEGKHTTEPDPSQTKLDGSDLIESDPLWDSRSDDPKQKQRHDGAPEAGPNITRSREEAALPHAERITPNDHLDQMMEEFGKDHHMTPVESSSIDLEGPSRHKPRPSKGARPGRYNDELILRRSVGVTALGRKIEAVMLRNPNKIKTSRVDVPIVERDQPSIPFDLKTVVAQPGENEDGDILDEAFRNIEELRPTDTTVLRPSQFQELQDTLIGGFTTLQLQSYVQSQPEVVTEDIAPYEWIRGHFDYAGTVKSRADPEDSITRPSKKNTLALKIMLRTWRLETEDESQKVGQMGFILRDDAWWLLNQPGSALASSIKQDFLGLSRTESFVLVPAGDGLRNTLVLRTSRATVSAILARIDNAVKSIVSSTISTDLLKPIQGDEWSQDHLDMLGRDTQTRIVRDPDSSALTVSWVPSVDRPAPQKDDMNETCTSHLETPADVVYRLMARKVFPQMETGRPVKSRNLVPYVRGLRGLSAHERIRFTWARDVLLDKSPAPGSGPVSLSPGLETRPAGQGSSEKLMVTFGHLLIGSTPSRKKKAAEGTANTAFLPVVPHPASLSSLINISQDEWRPVTKETTIVLHFEPHPTAIDRRHASNVWFHMPIRPGVDLSNFTIPPEARLERVVERRTAFPFPHAAVDARTHEQLLMPLDMTARPFQDFLSASVFNLADGRLRTPSTTSFQVQAAGDNLDTEREDMPYLFVGLEVHQSVEMLWKGVTLRYNSIEAGLHGGQRQEVSLVADVARECTATDRKAMYQSMAELMEDVAQGKYFSWSRGSANIELSDANVQDRHPSGS